MLDSGKETAGGHLDWCILRGRWNNRILNTAATGKKHSGSKQEKLRITTQVAENYLLLCKIIPLSVSFGCGSDSNWYQAPLRALLAMGQYEDALMMEPGQSGTVVQSIASSVYNLIAFQNFLS